MKKINLVSSSGFKLLLCRFHKLLNVSFNVFYRFRDSVFSRSVILSENPADDQSHCGYLLMTKLTWYQHVRKPYVPLILCTRYSLVETRTCANKKSTYAHNVSTLSQVFTFEQDSSSRAQHLFTCQTRYKIITVDLVMFIQDTNVCTEVIFLCKQYSNLLNNKLTLHTR